MYRENGYASREKDGEEDIAVMHIKNIKIINQL